jgi:hypothetical protein
MAIDPANIIYTYSGGINNANSEKSLGGDSSVIPIGGKRLFDDVSEENRRSGIEDYRCFYVHNYDNENSLYNAVFSRTYSVIGDVTVQIGFNPIDEVQTFTITNPVNITGGFYFVLYYQTNAQYSYVTWYNDYNVMATNLQTAIRSMNVYDANGDRIFQDVVVDALQSYSPTEWTYNFNFIDKAGKRYYETLYADSGVLTGSGIDFNFNKLINGSPINFAADIIDNGTTPPNLMSFSDDPSDFLCDLRPNDFVSVWIKRTVPSNTTAIVDDGFTFNVTGDAVAT